MSIRIVETISKKKNDDAKKWYEDKLKQLANFLVNRAKNQIIYTDNPIFSEQEELEVMVK